MYVRALVVMVCEAYIIWPVVSGLPPAHSALTSTPALEHAGLTTVLGLLPWLGPLPFSLSPISNITPSVRSG